MAHDRRDAVWTAGLNRRQLLGGGAALFLSGHASRAAGHSLLTIASDSGEMVLDRADLEALPQQNFDTSTIWTSGQMTFSGPPLRSVLATAGIATGRVELIAANDYRVGIDLADLGAEVPILATRIDGSPFSRREKGPLWLVYPYDADPAFRSEAIYARSIWQIVRIEVFPG